MKAPDHITLAVEDTDQAAVFYAQAFGWTAEKNDDDPALRIIRFGQLKIALYPTGKLGGLLHADANCLGGSLISVPVESMTEMSSVIKAAEAAGAEILLRPQQAAWKGSIAFLRDPFGHFWELSFRDDKI